MADFGGKPNEAVSAALGKCLGKPRRGAIVYRRGILAGLSNEAPVRR
ncbi:MAG TPA: hypothetical protein VKI44_03690 [Acetobacteraceae bacterium]|nr:hypothetical protein [Acetobacteraceae bacterium]